MNLLPVLAAPTVISEVSNVPSLSSSGEDKDLETIKEKKDSVLREGQLLLGPNEYAAYQDYLSDFAELCCGAVKEFKRLEFSPVEIDLVVQTCLKDITKGSFQFKQELLEYQQKKNETIKRDNEINAKVKRIPGNFSNFDVPENSTNDSYSDFLKSVSQRIGDPMQAHKEMNIEQNIFLAAIGAKLFNSFSTLVAHVICLPQYSSASRKLCYDVFDPPSSKEEDGNKKSALENLLKMLYGISSEKTLDFENNATVIAENVAFGVLGGGFALGGITKAVVKKTVVQTTKASVKSTYKDLIHTTTLDHCNVPESVRAKLREKKLRHFKLIEKEKKILQSPAGQFPRLILSEDSPKTLQQFLSHAEKLPVNIKGVVKGNVMQLEMEDVVIFYINNRHLKKTVTTVPTEIRTQRIVDFVLQVAKNKRKDARCIYNPNGQAVIQSLTSEQLQQITARGALNKGYNEEELLTILQFTFPK